MLGEQGNRRNPIDEIAVDTDCALDRAITGTAGIWLDRTDTERCALTRDVGRLIQESGESSRSPL